MWDSISSQSDDRHFVPDLSHPRHCRPGGALASSAIDLQPLVLTVRHRAPITTYRGASHLPPQRGASPFDHSKCEPLILNGTPGMCWLLIADSPHVIRPHLACSILVLQLAQGNGAV